MGKNKGKATNDRNALARDIMQLKAAINHRFEVANKQFEALKNLYSHLIREPLTKLDLITQAVYVEARAIKELMIDKGLVTAEEIDAKLKSVAEARDAELNKIIEERLEQANKQKEESEATEESKEQEGESNEG